MRAIRLQTLVLTALLAAAAAMPSASWAAPAKSAVAPPKDVQVQLWPSEPSNAALMMVTATVPDGASFPYEMRLPLPQGAQISWAGEVFGGDVGSDIKRPHTVSQGRGGQIVVFTVQKSRTAQYEAAVASPVVMNGRSVARLAWVQSAAAGTVAFAVKTTSGVTDVKITPPSTTPPQRDQMGNALYDAGVTALKSGATYTVDVSYLRGTAGQTPAAGGGSSIAFPLAVVLLIISATALVVRLRRGRTAAGGGRPDAGDRPKREPRPNAPAPQPSDDAFDLD